MQNLCKNRENFGNICIISIRMKKAKNCPLVVGNIRDYQLKLSAKSRKYRGVFKVKSRVKTRQVQEIWSQQFEHKQVPKGDGTRCPEGLKRSLLACHSHCKYSMETTHNSVKVKLGIQVMELVESLISWEVTVGQGSECHLIFVRGRLHITE